MPPVGCRCVLATGGRALFHRLTGSKTPAESPSTQSATASVSAMPVHPPSLPSAFPPHSLINHPWHLTSQRITASNREFTRPIYQSSAVPTSGALQGEVASMQPHRGHGHVPPLQHGLRPPHLVLSPFAVTGLLPRTAAFHTFGGRFSCIPPSFADVVQSRSPPAHHHWAAQASLSTARHGPS